MKRPVVFLLICMILLAAVFPALALAEGAGVSMQITASPSELSGEGGVTFAFTVTNEGDVALRDLEVILPNVWGTFDITDPWGGDGDCTMLAPGESITRELTHTVRASELNTRLPFVLNGYGVLLYTGGAEAGDNDRVQTVSYVTVKKAAAPTPAPTVAPVPPRPIPDVTGYISFSRTVALAGSAVEARISVENTGNVPVENIRVYLPKATGGDPVNNAFALDVGQDKRISAGFTLEKDVVVTPVIQFDYDGQTYKQTLESYELHAADPEIYIVATVGSTTPPMGGSVDVRVTVVNNGAERLNDLIVTDYMGNLLALQQNWLDAGRSLDIAVSERFSVPTELYYSVSAGDESGDCVDAVSEMIEITPVTNAGDVKLHLTAKAEPSALSAPGSVTFSVTVSNDGDYELHSVSVSGDTLGVIGKIDSFSPGEKRTFKTSAAVAASTSVGFAAAAQDASGGSHTAAVSVSVPLVSSTPAAGGATISEGIPTLWIIIGAAALVVIVVLIVLLVTRGKKK